MKRTWFRNFAVKLKRLFCSKTNTFLPSSPLFEHNSSAIIVYCLVAIVQHDLQLKRSTYEVLQNLIILLWIRPHS